MVPVRNLKTNDLKIAHNSYEKKVHTRCKLPDSVESGLRIEVFYQLEGLDGDGWIVFVGVANGKTVKETSKELGISPQKVMRYLRDIKKRLGVQRNKSISELVFTKTEI